MSTMDCCLHDTPNVASCLSVQAGRCEHLMLHMSYHEVIKAGLPGRLYEIYMEYKRDEWDRFNAEVSDWDLKTYLDCLP